VNLSRERWISVRRVGGSSWDRMPVPGRTYTPPPGRTCAKSSESIAPSMPASLLGLPGNVNTAEAYIPGMSKASPIRECAKLRGIFPCGRITIPSEQVRHEPLEADLPVASCGGTHLGVPSPIVWVHMLGMTRTKDPRPAVFRSTNVTMPISFPPPPDQNREQSNDPDTPWRVCLCCFPIGVSRLVRLLDPVGFFVRSRLRRMKISNCRWL